MSIPELKENLINKIRQTNDELLVEELWSLMGLGKPEVSLGLMKARSWL